MRYAFVAVVLWLGVGPAQAESYTVWADSGEIWARDAATGTEWALWDNPQYPAHSPFAHGSLALWVMDFSYSQDLMGHQFGGGRSYFSVHVTPEQVSDPQCWWTGDSAPEIRAFAAWRQGGGLWGRALYTWQAEQLVANYAGPYALDGDIVTWDSGSANLREMAMAQQIPEPGTLVLLSIGLVCCLCYHWRRH